MGEIVTINENQNYEFYFSEGRRDKKICTINYYFSGEGWQKVWDAMKSGNLTASNLLFYAGARIDKKNATVFIRGGFRKNVVQEKHNSFWRAFFKNEPIFKEDGFGVKMPSSSDLDNINIFVNGIKC